MYETSLSKRCYADVGLEAKSLYPATILCVYAAGTVLARTGDTGVGSPERARLRVHGEGEARAREARQGRRTSLRLLHGEGRWGRDGVPMHNVIALR